MPGEMLLVVRTFRRRYAVRRGDLLAVLPTDAGAAPQVEDTLGRGCVPVELGPLLEPNDRGTARRQVALVVPLRRRLIALLVDAVESFHPVSLMAPLPEVLRARLRRPWAIGALPLDENLIVALDARALALGIRTPAA
jgi:hypothetical protein